MLSLDRLKVDRDEIKEKGGDTKILDKFIDSKEALNEKQAREWAARQ